MKRRIWQLTAITAGVGLVLIISGCCSLFWHVGCAPKIVKQPESQVVLKDTPVTFSVVTSPSTNVFYQWQFNGTTIAGATDSAFTISSVKFTDVGEYRVQVWGSPTNTSQTAYLSVYSLPSRTTPTTGSLQTPIGLFTSAGTTTCGTYQKWYNPHDASGPYLFYGPNATGQTGPFVNTTAGTTLTVNTFDSVNSPADTGLMLQNNFVPTWPPVACNDDAPGQAPLSQIGPFTLGTIAGKNTYRLTIMYKTTPPASGSITIHWTYQ